MKVLVTGGAGFIGSHIVDVLIEKGNEVIVLDNLSTGKKEFINSNAKFYQKDILEDIFSIFEKEKPELVIHCAAQVMLRESLNNPLFDAKTNILGTINVLEACRKNKIKKIIYTSSVARVGEPKYIPVDEKHLINPSSPYGISKHTAEHYVQMYAELHGLDSLIFCFGNVYGPRDDPMHQRVVGIFADKMLNGEEPTIFGDGEQTRDFIYVKDLAKFMVESINKNPKHKLFHLANGTQIKINEMANLLKELTDFKGNFKYGDSIKGEVKDICLDTSLVEKELGWNPRYSFDQGLKETVEYFKKELAKKGE